MKRKSIWLLVLLLTWMLVAGCSNTAKAPVSQEPAKPAEKKELIISAAASLKNVMTELETAYEAKNSGVNLTFNYGGSGSLQNQIEQGAPADLFVSAGKSQMDALAQKNLLLSDTRVDLLGNDLVLVVSPQNTNITKMEDLVKADKISIGTPESVPAGKYAKEALTELSLWAAVEPKLVLAKDVTQVLTYVETENVQAGLVYQSDAQGSTKVKIVAAVPADRHSPIIYPAAVIAATKNPDEAKAFLAYLQSAEAQAIFTKYGFKSGK